MATAAVAGGVAATTMLVGLVTNAVSEESHWPVWLGWMQAHPWLSFLVLGLAMVVLTALLSALSEARAAEDGPPPTPPVGPDDDARPPGAALVLRSLPRDTAVFTNRSAELERLVSTVRAAQSQGDPLPVHVIDGMPGVGKTSLVIRAGHMLSERFPDGQLFVNLNGHTPGRDPVPPSDALASLLAAAGVPAQRIPVGPDMGAVTEARSAMWRGWLADRRVLLVLDNAASHRQWEPLLPGSGGSLVLVTSRKRLSAHEEVTMPIEALPPDHATALFLRLSGRPADSMAQDVLADLVGLCGYLPLGVSLLAARLRHHPSWSGEQLRTRLLAARDRLGEMRAGERAVASAFDLSYADLPTGRQRFFRRLGWYPGTDIDAYAGAALVGVPTADARRHLDDLYDDHLIDEQPGGRYRLHDLLRDYARGLADEEESMEHTAAVRRVCAYYVAALGEANRHLARGGPAAAPPGPDSGGRLGAGAPPGVQIPVPGTRATALRWLEDERPTILACVEQARQLSLHAPVIRLAAAIAPFLRQAGPWDQAAGLHLAAADAARRTGDRAALADTLTELGVVRRLMARYTEAAAALTEAVAEYEAVGDRLGQARALNQAGIVHYMTADNEAAARAQTRALAIHRELGDRLGQANALADLGMVRRQTSRFDAARETQTEALAIYRELDDRYGEANSLRDLGVVHGLTGAYDLAAQRHRAALAIYQELDDRVHQAYALNELGVIHRLTGDAAAARTAHEQARTYFTELGDQFGRANSVRALGVLDRLDGRPDQAVRAQREALDLYRGLGSRGGEAAALGELGAALTAAGDTAAAAEAFAGALEILRELGDRCGEAEVHNHWGTLSLGSGEPVAGRTHFDQALGLARRIGCPLEEARALEGTGRCDLALLGRDGAEGPLRAALDIYRRLGATRAVADVERLLPAQAG